MERHEHASGTIEELWALVHEQRVEIEQLKAKRQRRGWGRGITRFVSVGLSLLLIAVMGGIAYAGVPTMRAGATPPAQTGYYVRWNGSRWVSSYIQPTDVPALPFAGDVSGNQYGATVTGLQGVAVGSAAPTTGQFLQYSGTSWQAHSLQASDVPSLSSAYVDLSSDQTVGGTKTFSQAIHASKGVAFPDGYTQSVAALKVVSGVVNPNGSVFVGKGFTVTHPGAGVYVVSWPAGTFGDGSPFAVAMAQGLFGATTTMAGYDTNGDGSGSFEVHCGGTDGTFAFTVTQARY